MPRIAAVSVLLALSGCSGFESMEYRFRDMSLSDRCIYFAKEAFPEMRLADTKVQSATDMDVTTTRIDGVNENAGTTGQLRRDVAVECRFENGILTDFRWTAGPFR